MWTQDQHLNAFADATKVVLYAWDVPAGRIRRWGRSAELIGLSPEDMPPEPDAWLSRIHPDDAAKAPLNAILQHRSDRFEVRYRIRLPDARFLEVVDRGSILRDPQGHATTIVGALLPATAPGTSAAADLARLRAELDQFAHVVSHDLRAPLASISGCAQLLAEEYGHGNEETQQLVDFIQSSVTQMGDLIRALLDYSRAGSGEVTRTECTTEQIVDTVIGNRRDQLNRAGATVTRDPLPPVFANRTQLTQLFEHLIDNAVKFGGEQPRVHISARETDAGWIFSVRDSGIGIAPAHHDKVFLAFHRIEGRVKSGIGIGLATCRRIVERHGGRIWVESSPGQGATFHFSLPRDAGTVSAASKP